MATPKILPSRELVCRLLDYDPTTGSLTWRVRPHGMQRWNTRYAGKAAGNVRPNGYINVMMRPHRYFAHRLIWLMVHGAPVPDEIDHIDLNPTNNRLDNLRAATRAQNNANSVIRSHNKLGVKGVHRHYNRFVALITVKRRTHYLGCYNTIDEAAAAYKLAAIKYYGKFSRS